MLFAEQKIRGFLPATSIGPFDSKEEADATARDAQNIVGEFDVRKQCVYLMYPDHRLVEYFPADFE